jgi:serine phosphatase RsbU (regulator of sigma subunit)
LRRALEQGRNAENPAALVSAIRADIAQFVGGAEATDDLTLLVLRWNGPSAR